MIPLLLLACTTSPVTDTNPTFTMTQPTNQPEVVPFENPIEAVDIDDDPNIHHIELTADHHTYTVHGHEMQGYAYNQVIPGPTIRAKVGDRLIVDLTNNLDTPTTIHWHGVDVPWDQDGIVWMQEPVESGDERRYEFTLNRAMTAWYHPHFDTEKQIDLGLYGVLIVEDPEAPPADQEITLVFDSWGEFSEMTTMATTTQDKHDHGESGWVSAHDWTVNSTMMPTISALGGERIRARLVNTSNTGYLKISWPDIRHIGGDQGLLAQPGAPDHLVLGPGDREEVELLIGDEPFSIMAHPYSLFGGDAVGMPMAVAHVTISGPGMKSNPLPLDYSYASPTLDPGYTDVRYTFQGFGENWMINGETFPDVTIAEFEVGQEIIMEVRNISPTQHPFHTHGHAFEVLTLNGEAPRVKLMSDNYDIPIGGIARLRMELNNPGDWMVHCHILPHADDGMMTVMRVLE
jgi:FtsP/CotA-like multicopper oxidase with cupredoxin domain